MTDYTQFLSTLPARGATSQTGCRNCRAGKFLSTLPARGATPRRQLVYSRNPKFLSTLPARGATCGRLLPSWSGQHFYPRSPRGERQEY